ncbi:MAG: FAD binding domain-containing protein [Anaerolineaceae bacterium]
MWKQYHIVETVEELLKRLASQEGKTKIIAGGTDLMVEIRNGKWPELETVLDISRIKGLDQITRDGEGVIHVGALVTHNDILRSALIREYGLPLLQACARVASPQLRNRGTVAGNLITASPANDTITPLMAMEAELVLVSSKNNRIIPLRDFYTGLRKTVLHSDEFVSEIRFQGLTADQPGNFKKNALRRAQAISVLNCCAVLTMNAGKIEKAALTLGSVAPTVLHARSAEKFLQGKVLDEEVIAQASDLAVADAAPISDIRATDAYRAYMLKVLVEQALTEIQNGGAAGSVPARVPTLDSKTGFSGSPAENWDGKLIHTTINGQEYFLPDYSDQTLMSLIRERVGLIGTKTGCEEGECGACTVFLDGKAVVSCLIPAPRAHNAVITTVEGISDGDALHPVQQAFIDHAAVQCGYCTPGFVMSAVKLLEEMPRPDRESIQRGISGNLCRCTGYYKIIQAIESASLRMEV